MNYLQQQRRKACWGGLMAAVLAASGAGALERAMPIDVYRAQLPKIPATQRDWAQETLGHPWRFQDQSNGGFTFVAPEIRDLVVKDGVLRFRAGAERVMLGWGNYENCQALTNRVALWPNYNSIELKVRQTAATGQWSVALWQDGKPNHPSLVPEKCVAMCPVTGGVWQTLTFPLQMPAADGFSLDIKGPADNTVEIESLRIYEIRRTAYLRKTVALPKGKVWQALAEVSQLMRLFVNGQEVPFQEYNNVLFPTTAVDIKPYLKPGSQNTLAMVLDHVVRPDMAGANTVHEGYLQGRIVMDSGEAITLDTPAGWKMALKADGNWMIPAYDDQTWKTPEVFPRGAGSDNFSRRPPINDGRIVLENPGADPKLFFDDTQALKVRVRIPRGLADQTPKVRWILRKAPVEVSPAATEEEVTYGSEDRFRKDDRTASLVCEIDAGRQPRGVYTLEVDVDSPNGRLEHRLREPLAVVGKIPMPVVKGTNFEDGLKLVLEDQIDFTNPKDPHPSIDVERPEGSAPGKVVAEPRIVKKDGLLYRKTGTGVGAGLTAHFAYQVRFQKPGSFYMLVLEYPDDDSRNIGVSVEAVDQWGEVRSDKQHENTSGPAVITGFKFPVSNRMQEMRWFHYTYTSNYIVHVASLAKERRAAARRLRIYRVVGELPAIQTNPSGERWLGLHTERARSVARLYGTDDPGPYQVVYFDKLGLDSLQAAVHRLKWQLEGCENYARYLRFTGQNIHVMGAFQYDEHNLPYDPPDSFETSRIPCLDIREIALRVFDRNGIASMSMVEYCVHKWLSERYAVTDAQVGRGADTVFPVSKDGKQAGGAGCVSQACYDHPEVQKAYQMVIEQLARKFAFSPAWKGVYLMAFPTFAGPVTYAPLSGPFDYDYSDATLAAFTRDTGITVPTAPADPQRFEKRWRFLATDTMRSKWTEWRIRTVRDQVLKTRDLLQRHRQDLQVCYGFYFSSAYMPEQIKSGRPYRDYLRDFGWDPAAFRDDADIWTGRYFYPNSPANLHGGDGVGYPWEQEVGPEAIAAFDRKTKRLAVFCTGWHEIDMLAPGIGWNEQYQPVGVQTNWPLARVHARFVSQPCGDFARENFTQALLGADVQAIFYGFTDAMFPMGYEQALREFAALFTALPGETFTPVQGTADFRHNLAIRELRRGGDYWFYVANPGYWPIKGKVVLSGPVQLVNPATDEVIPTKEIEGKTIVPVDLKGFGVAAFVARGLSVVRRPLSGVRIASWTNEPIVAADLKHMEDLLGKADKYLADERVCQAITVADRVFMRGVAAEAHAALEAGSAALAWSLITQGRFWSPLFDQLDREARFAAYIPGYQPVAREQGQIPELAVAKAEPRPVIDGKLDDPVWQKAAKTIAFVGQGAEGQFRGKPVVDTYAQAAYDDDTLYLAFVMADPDIAALRAVAVQPPDTLTAYDDTLLMMLNPAGTKVFQMAVNAAGMRYNAEATGQSGYFRRHDADFGPWQAAVGKTDKVWMLEVAIPFATLKTPPCKSGAALRANFLRRFRQFKVPEMYWAQIRKSWYELEQYGVLKFM